jgi:lipoprotein signal peptidase
VRGELDTTHQTLVAVYPLAFFYLVACTLEAIALQVQPIARRWKLVFLAWGLALLDQAVKAVVCAGIPYQASIPIVEGWLHLAHERNFNGSWIVSEFDLQGGGFLGLVLWGLVIVVLIISILWHHYYTTTQRQSFWADTAFLGLFAGLSSWVCDMSLRSYTLDYIGLPGLVTADLKDIYISIGVAAIFVEMLENPKLSWRWAGWREERDAAGRFLEFTVQVLSEAVQKVRRMLKRRKS